jgi:hypothetical protein
MVEAISTLSRSQRAAQRMRQAVGVLCERQAMLELKEQIRREGKIKLSSVPRREIVALARARLINDPAYLSRLMADARRVVEQWRVEGFFGKVAQALAPKEPEDKDKCSGAILVAAVQHSKDLHNAGRPEPQTLPLCKTYDRNGATR